ncbi:MAG: T9SS type A sorting domain-containing protein [Bacteroidales bacterium]|nr:T9SS type A sorting domain-containing protein [Bacteroidales bacterium]
MKHFYNFQRLALIFVALFTNFLISQAQDYDFVVNELGLCVMEAENYSEMVQIGEIGSGTESLWDTASSPVDFSGVGGMKAVNPGAAPGDIAVALTSAGILKYNINFTEAGQYYIWARASRTGGSDDSFHAAIAQGEEIKNQVAYINFEGELVPTPSTNVWVWIYRSQPLEGAASVMVPVAGVYNFRVYVRERGFRLDKIILSRNPGYVPDGVGPEETAKVTGLADQKVQNNASLSIYPNPFAGNAALSYKLESAELVSIKVYNALGEEVAVLLNEVKQPGAHELSFNLSDHSNSTGNGVYFIRFQSGSEIQTIKAFHTK